MDLVQRGLSHYLVTISGNYWFRDALSIHEIPSDKSLFCSFSAGFPFDALPLRCISTVFSIFPHCVWSILNLWTAWWSFIPCKRFVKINDVWPCVDATFLNYQVPVWYKGFMRTVKSVDSSRLAIRSWNELLFSLTQAITEGNLDETRETLVQVISRRKQDHGNKRTAHNRLKVFLSLPTSAYCK